MNAFCSHSALLTGCWAGCVNGNPAEGLAGVIDKGYKLNVQILNLLAEVRHAYTHFKVTEYAFRCKLIQLSQNENLRWVALDELDDYPMGKIDRQIAQKISFPPMSGGS